MSVCPPLWRGRRRICPRSSLESIELLYTNRVLPTFEPTDRGVNPDRRGALSGWRPWAPSNLSPDHQRAPRPRRDQRRASTAGSLCSPRARQAPPFPPFASGSILAETPSRAPAACWTTSTTAMAVRRRRFSAAGLASRRSTGHTMPRPICLHRPLRPEGRSRRRGSQRKSADSFRGLFRLSHKPLADQLANSY